MQNGKIVCTSYVYSANILTSRRASLTNFVSIQRHRMLGYIGKNNE